MIRLLQILLAISLASSALFAEDWPQFRGLNGSGVSSQSRHLPAKFSQSEKVLWSADVGEGVASPVIVAGRVFTTAMKNPRTFSVIAFDEASGKKLWATDFPVSNLPKITWPNTHASSTPVADAERVYVHFSTIGLIALDVAKGDIAWKRPLEQPFYLMDWGSAQAPMLYKDLLIYCQDDDLAPFMVGIDKKTGDVRWRTERDDMLAGYALPVICRANGRDDLVIAGTGKLKGYDPLTGKERWTCNSLLRTIMTSPVVQDDRVFISVQSYGDTSRVLKFALLEWKDTNQDGKLSKSELDGAFAAKFDKGDANKDGFLVGEEIDRAFQSPNNMSGGGNILQAIRAGGEGDVTKTHMVWKLDNAAPSNIASPLVVDGRVFVVKKGGIASCFNAKDGSTLWMLKRIRNLGNYYASPVAGDGKIYVAGDNGMIVVLKQSAELEFLAKNDMGEGVIATPAIANDRLYVRTINKLYCLGETKVADR